MTATTVRARVPRRRWTGAIAVAAALVAAGLLVADRRDGQEQTVPPAGFDLARDVAGRSTAVGTDLDHPIPADLESNRSDVAARAAIADPTGALQRFRSAERQTVQDLRSWRPTSIFRMLDTASEDLQVQDGLRRTWQPPPCDCPTVTLWMYGGSTTYGLNQRDDHTIASELARLAHAGGVRLVVENHGVMGYLHWLEAERFAYDLALRPAPDAVLFYDGINDMWAANSHSARRSGDVRLLADPTTIDVWNNAGPGEAAAPNAPPGGRLLGWDRDVDLSPESLAQLTVVRYDRARRISARLAALHGTQAMYVWQPTRVSRDLVRAEPHGNADEERYMRLIDQLQRSHLADDVIDVVDAFDGTTEPLFTDDVHHNELGARLVAEAIYAEIEPIIRTLAEAR